FGLQRPAHAAPVSGRATGEYPFRLGVASGDPLPDGVVLWTRLAPRPLEPYGGMPSGEAVRVSWEIAGDEAFTEPIRSGTALADPAYAHSVHVDVRGLLPGRHYWYRFTALGHRSEVARTRTAPGPTAMDRMRFAFASCMNYRSGYFQVMSEIADRDLDGVFFLGDYIYEYPVQQISPGRQLPPDLPPEVVPETYTLDQYRLRYALYKSQPEVIAAHRNAPWMMMWDDHEVDNDYESDTEAELLRQAAAYRAYWEHMPLRLPQRPVGPEGRLHRRLRYGAMAQFDMLDARQYRDPQLRPGTIYDSPERRDPARSILGTEQEQWFAAGLGAAPARWNIVPQGVLMALVNTANAPDATPTYSSGNWDGYQASQQRVLDAVAAARRAETLRNFVVLTGDVHCGYVSHLLSDTRDPGSASLGTEFTSLSVSSARDFDPAANERRQIRTVVNPQMKWADLHCGYVHVDLNADRMRLDFRGVDKVSRPDDPMFALQRFVVADGVPEIQFA
ncbi:MAG: alkaline phosphatase D family protein, partial [Micromonosporaceae bacterium]